MYLSNVMKGGYAQKDRYYRMTEFLPVEESPSAHDAIDDYAERQRQSLGACAAAILDGARKEAQRILEDARKKADEVVKEAEKRAEQLYAESFRAGQNDGYAHGYQAGEAAAQKKMEVAADQLKAVSDCLAKQREEFINKYRSMVIDLAMDIASKIACDNFTKGGGVFYSVFEDVVKKIPPADKLILTVSELDFEIVAHDVGRLRSIAEGFGSIEVRCDADAPAGTLLLESPVMVIDAGVNTQLELLKSSLATVGE